MNGLSIIETETVSAIFKRLSNMEEMFKETVKMVQEGGGEWMDVEETAKHMKKSESWVYKNKRLLGFSKSGSDIIFNRKKVDEYYWSIFFQSVQK